MMQFLNSPTRWLAACVLALGACGGGGGVDIGGTGAEPPTYSNGPITGFGSIIVNGVHFDEAAAKVEDADGVARTASQLKLGMVVQVDADAIVVGTAISTAKASTVRFGSELLGPVQSFNATTGVLKVLGQTVTLSATTVLDDRLVGGTAALTVGKVVEVYGLYDPATQGVRATRIEPAGVVVAYRLRGVVAGLDTAMRTLTIGAGTYTYGSGMAPGDLSVGQYQRLSLGLVADSGGRLPVMAFGTAPSLPLERKAAEVRGVVDSFTSTSSFRVNGVTVNAAAATFPDGTAGLALGARVQARGSVTGGVLVATAVEIDTDQKVEERGFELSGTIESVNLAGKTLVLRGTTVDWSDPNLRFDKGTVADLVVGRKVEIKGLLSADRTRLRAQRVEFDN
jgi:Domain of unknown function (DUF5666)